MGKAARKKKLPVHRDLEFAGYKFTSSPEGTAVHREMVDARDPRDYGADPLGDGTFRMVPSGDVVDFEERNRRLARSNMARTDIQATSKDRYRASAAERRQYGGSTVTEFYVFRKEDKNEPSKWKVVRGYGPTPGERKTDAIKRSGLLDDGPTATSNVYRPGLQSIYYVYTSPEAKLPTYEVLAADPKHAIVQATEIARESGDNHKSKDWRATTVKPVFTNAEPNQELNLQQKRDELVEEVENWVEQDPYALPNAFFLVIAHDAGVGLTDDEAVFEGEVYDLEDDEDRDEIGHELVEQIRNASTGQVNGYYAHRTRLIEEDVGPDEADEPDDVEGGMSNTPNAIVFKKDERLDEIDRLREVSRARARSGEAARVVEQAHRDSWLGFTDTLSPSAKRRAVDVLGKQVSVRGEFAARGDHVVRLVNAGWVVKEGRGGRELIGPDGGFFREGDLTKLGLDFAAYLAAQSGVG